MFSHTCQTIYVRDREYTSGGHCIHCLVHLLGRELAMYVLHRLAGLLHRQERLLVDVGRLDGIYLLLQRSDLRLSLLEAVFVLLLAFQCGLRSCSHRRGKVSMCNDAGSPVRAGSICPHQSYCLWRRISGPGHLAHPSGFAGASRASAACRAVTEARGWRSWGHSSASERRPRQTSPGPSQTFCFTDVSVCRRKRDSVGCAPGDIKRRGRLSRASGRKVCGR